MTTETMREAVARAMDEALRAIESDARLSELTDDEVRALTDAAIRTVLERLREPTMLLGQYASHHVGCAIYQRSWASGEPPCTCGLDKARAMLDAAVREVG